MPTLLQRLPRMRRFWSAVELPVAAGGALDAFGLGGWIDNMTAVTRGVPAFYEPSATAWRGARAELGIERAAYYSVEPLRRTLDSLTDLAAVKRGGTRMTVD